MSAIFEHTRRRQSRDRLIEQQIFALDMDVLTNRMQCLQIEDKVITLLNELWDQMCINTTARCTVEIACEEDGMEFTVGELMVPIFYFMNEKKFLCQLQDLLKSKVLWEDWLKTDLSAICERLDE